MWCKKNIPTIIGMLMWIELSQFRGPNSRYWMRTPLQDFCGPGSAWQRSKQLPDLIFCCLRCGLACRKQPKSKDGRWEAKARQSSKTEEYVLHRSQRRRASRNHLKSKKETRNPFRSGYAVQDGDKRAFWGATGNSSEWRHPPTQENQVCLKSGGSRIYMEASGVHSSEKSWRSHRWEGV